MSFFKKKENEFSTGKKKPKLKPFGGDAEEKTGTSGKGGGQPAEPTYDVTASDWSDQVAKFNKKGGINNDGRFGYGYVDTETGIEVPWYIDMINGGGANAAGDTFVSPFEGTLAGLPAQAVTGGLNAMGVAPYGSNRPRYFMPMEAARVDAEGKPVQVDLGPASTGVGSPTVTPDPIQAPTQDFSNLSEAPAIRSGLIGYSPQVIAGEPLPSPTTAAQTTPQMDYLMNIAQQTVMRRFPTMPAQERDAHIEAEYQRLYRALEPSQINTSTTVPTQRPVAPLPIGGKLPPYASVAQRQQYNYNRYKAAGGELSFEDFIKRQGG